jgi:hypothetical protein
MSFDIKDNIGLYDDKILYKYHPLLMLFESIKLINGFRIEVKASNPEGSIAHNQILLLDLVVKYCQLAESFGAYIHGLVLSKANSYPRSSNILNYLTTYKVHRVKEFLVPIASLIKAIPIAYKYDIEHAFGYTTCKDRQNVNLSISNLFDDLKNFFQIYFWHHDLYNAFKHGHRAIYGYNIETGEGNSVIYMEKSKVKNQFSAHHVALDEKIIEDSIIPYSEKFRIIYEILWWNNYCQETNQINYIKYYL